MHGTAIAWESVPELGEYDILVCGAGPAGLGAALAAGRAGARTLLCERQFCVGGMATCTGINTWCDTPGGSLFDELVERLAELGKARWTFNPQGHTHPPGRVTLHGETMKAVAMRMLAEANVCVMLGTTAAAVQVVDGTARSVLLATKAGLTQAPAKVVIDCTADADVAAQAGAAFIKGDAGDGRLMHVNFSFQLGGVDRAAYEAQLPSAEQLLSWIAEAREAGRLRPPKGVFRPAAATFPYHPPEEALALTSWEIEKVDCSDPVAVSETLVDCNLRALEIVEFCREYLPGHQDCAISRVWEVLGTRESRRLAGRHTVRGEDVVAGTKFDDGIARACFFIDFHDSPPGRTIPYDLQFKVDHTPPPGDYYEIPYRCLLPVELEGLLVAGRCISADRAALASLRVMPTCMFLGQAAGTAAALAASRGVMPSGLDGAELKGMLLGE